MNKSLSNSIKLYIIIIISIIIFKPNFLYDNKHKRFKSFGTRKNTTILSLPIFSILLAVLTYTFFQWIEKINFLQNQYNDFIKNNINK
jgi:hypothetical protein